MQFSFVGFSSIFCSNVTKFDPSSHPSLRATTALIHVTVRNMCLCGLSEDTFVLRAKVILCIIYAAVYYTQEYRYIICIKNNEAKYFLMATVFQTY